MVEQMKSSVFKRFTRVFVTCLFLQVVSSTVYGQTVTPTNDPNKLVKTFVGNRAIVSNVKCNCAARAIGTYTGAGGTNLGIDEGVILTTGDAHVFGNNSPGNTSVDNQWPGDGDISNMKGGQTTADACVLEFDFVPLDNKLRPFQYVFGSEEYPDFVYADYSDAFAFYITGPKPVSGYYYKENIAVLSGNIPVAVDNINNGTGPRNTCYGNGLNTANRALFVENCATPTAPTKLWFDGFTTVLDTKELPLNPCATYHIKIVIADVGSTRQRVKHTRRTGIFNTSITYYSWDDVPDHIVESGVFLKAHSFGSSDAITTQAALKDIKNGTCTDNGAATCYVLNPQTSGSYTYAWYNANDPNTVIQTTSVATNLGAGTYYCRVTYTLCNQTIDVAKSPDVTITIPAKPSADFTVDPCSPIVTFTGTSGLANNQVASYTWSFGDNTTGTGQAPVHTYANYGNYTVTLTVVSIDGCTNTITKTITVSPTPVADFADIKSCSPTVTFTNKSTIPSPGVIASYYWDFGVSNATSTDSTPTYTYPGPGTYTVKLTATSDQGCANTKEQRITIYPVPVADFPVASSCSLSYNFTSTYTITSGSIAAYEWDLGDGTVAIGPNVSKTYAGPGTYTVTLKVISDKGCEHIVSKTFTIYPTPIADFIQPPASCSRTVSLVSTSTLTSGNSTFGWDFGDQSSTIGTSPYTSHTYANSGIYSVTLTVTSDHGCQSQKARTIIIYPTPVPSFDNVPNTCAKTISFHNRSTISGGKMAYQWNFGDLGTSTAQNPSHTYDNPGTYRVRLTVTSDKGCTATYAQVFTIYNTPDVNFAQPANTCNPTVTFTNTTTNIRPGDNPIYVWEFGDTKAELSNGNTVHTYDAPGTYTVTFTAITNNNCRSSVTKTFTIYPTPEIKLSQPKNTCSRTITFLNGSRIKTGSIVLYNWEFGDLSSTTTFLPGSVTHTYPGPGTYTVTLTGVSDKGCIGSNTTTFTIYPTPVASFTMPATACAQTTVSFTNRSTIIAPDVMNYYWDFGDGTSSTLKDPTHVYPTAGGTYTVTLRVISNHRCENTIQKTILIHPAPEPDFVQPSDTCGRTITFKNISKIAPPGTISTTRWEFGDASSSTQQNPTHTYSLAGYRRVRLILTSDNGCRSQVDKFFTIYPTPVANFSKSFGDCSKTVTYTNTSTIQYGRVAYEWDFGDGSISNDSIPKVVHNYVATGTYTVKLKAISVPGGCTSTSEQTVIIYPIANPSFTFSDVCVGATASFTNQSTLATGTMSYQWDFGDGYIATTKDATHAYENPGSYTVTLRVNSNCPATLQKTINVYPYATAEFYVDPKSCEPSATFINLSTIPSGGISYHWDFGDGTTSTDGAAQIVHNYSAGTYVVKLTAASDPVGCANMAQQTLTIAPGAKPDFTFSGICARKTTSFTNQSAIATGTMAYEWDFGDGTAKVNSKDATHIYAAAGTYVVTLKASATCDAIKKKTIQIDPTPLASFYVEPNTCSASVIFTNNSQPVGATTYTWDFGDGTTSNAPLPGPHTYAPGTYTVSLKLKSSNGCEDITTRQFTIHKKPVPDFASGFNCSSVVQFTNTSKHANGTPANDLTYQWQFPNAPSTSALENPSHDFVSTGTYAVTLNLTWYPGCNVSVTKNVDVKKVFPVANFTQPANTCSRTISFVNTSTIQQGYSITGYEWKFNDGETSVLTSPTHTYTTSGTYSVTLTAVSEKGCSSTVVKTVTIYPVPETDFNWEQRSCKGILFTNLSPDPTATYTWKFGDGVIYTGTDPTHNYPAFGTYTVTVTAVSATSCTASKQKTITIETPAAADFSYTNCDQVVTFKDETASGVSWQWIFSDGTTSTEQNPKHTFPATASYSATLKVTSGYGCITAVTKTLTFTPAMSYLTNGDFQSGTQPDNSGQINRAAPWFASSGTPDLFDERAACLTTFPCNIAALLPSCVDIPCNHFGTQSHRLPAAGSGRYAGLHYALNGLLKDNTTADSLFDSIQVIVEGMEQRLSTPLTQGKTYEVNLYASLAEYGLLQLPLGLLAPKEINFKVKMSTKAEFSPGVIGTLLPYNPAPGDLVYESTVTDQIIWQKKSFQFTAQKNYEYIIVETALGANIRTTLAKLVDVAQGGTLAINLESYMYIDDIRLSEACGPLVQNRMAAADNTPESRHLPDNIIGNARHISVFPNPTSGRFTLQGVETGSRIKVWDILGKERGLKIVSHEGDKIELDGTDLEAGLYYIQLETSGKCYLTKISISK